MDSSPRWYWDPNRQKHYRYNEQQREYIFQDGTRVPLPGSDQSPVDEMSNDPLSDDDSVYVKPSISSVENYKPGFAQHRNNYTGQQPGSSGFPNQPWSQNTPYGTSQQRLYQGYGDNSSKLGRAEPSPFASVRPQSEYAGSILQDSLLIDPTEQELESKGILETNFVPAPRDSISSNSNPRREFRKAKDPRKFFNFGRVFRTPLIDREEFTPETHLTSPKTDIHGKIHWFVVAIERSDHSICVPITTYGGEGVGSKGVIKHTHAIVYTGRTEPQPGKKEKSENGERGMLPSIRIMPKKKHDNLPPMSRINFGKIHTVQHTARTQEFGHVAKEHQDLFLQSVLKSLRAYIMPPSEEDDNDGETDEETDEAVKEAVEEEIDEIPDEEFEEQSEEDPIPMPSRRSHAQEKRSGLGKDKNNSYSNAKGKYRKGKERKDESDSDSDEEIPLPRRAKDSIYVGGKGKWKR